MTHSIYIAATALTLIAGITAPAITEASNDGWYAGAALGRMNADGGDTLPGFGDSAGSYRVFGGYSFGSHLALEAQYIDIGGLLGDILVDQVLRLDAAADAYGWGVAVAGRVPLGERFALGGKLGLLAWQGDVRAGDIAASDDGTDPYLIGGLQYAMTPHVTLSADYGRYRLDDIDLGVWSAGVAFRFD